MIIEPQRAKCGDSEIRIGDYSVKNTNKEKLLGVVLDSHLKFDHHIKKICSEAGKKILLRRREEKIVNENIYHYLF